MSTTGRFSTVFELPRQDIRLDPARFQGRQGEYSEDTVNAIVSSGRFDPTVSALVVWKDPDSGRFFLLSGHSRFEAAKRLYESGKQPGLTSLPVKELLNATEEEAVEYATIESNRRGTEEGLISDLKAYRLAKNSGKNSTQLKRLFRPDSRLHKLQDLSHLNPRGMFVEQLAKPSQQSFPYLERNARWVGDMRRQLPALTDAHERELFDYLYGSKKALNLDKSKFYDTVNNKVNRIDFDPDKALNLNDRISPTAYTDPINEQLREMDKEIETAQREIEQRRASIARARAEGIEVPKFQGRISFEERIAELNRHIIRLIEKKEALRQAGGKLERTMGGDLFSQVEETPKKFDHPFKVGDRVRYYGSEKRIGTVDQLRENDLVAVQFDGENKIAIYHQERLEPWSDIKANLAAPDIDEREKQAELKGQKNALPPIYRMLSRLQSDCDYFLGAGQRNEKHLHQGSVDTQIAEMKRLRNLLPADGKPEWLSMQDILNYEAMMKNKDVRVNIDRKGNKNGLIVRHKGKEYQVVYPADGYAEPYGIVFPGDDYVSFISTNKRAKALWKQLQPMVAAFNKTSAPKRKIHDAPGKGTISKEAVKKAVAKVAAAAPKFKLHQKVTAPITKGQVATIIQIREQGAHPHLYDIEWPIGMNHDMIDTVSESQLSEVAEKQAKVVATCPPIRDGKPDITPPGLKALQTCIADQGDTALLHKDHSGHYTAERKRVHEALVDEFRHQKPCITAPKKPIAVLTGGAPGSGKSHFLKGFAPWLNGDKVLHIDADEVRAKLPEYKGWNADNTHTETSHIVNMMLDSIGTPCKHDLVYDGTMNKAKKYLPLVAKLKAMGYEVLVIYMQVPKKVSMDRVMERYQRTGRYVPQHVIDEVYEQGLSAYEEVIKAADGYIRVDGVTGKILEKGGKPIPTEREYNGGALAKTKEPCCSSCAKEDGSTCEADKKTTSPFVLLARARAQRVRVLNLMMSEKREVFKSHPFPSSSGRLKAAMRRPDVVAAEKAIAAAKAKLIAYAKKKGISENFGQKEVRKLQDDFKANPHGNPDQRDIFRLIEEFENWTMNVE